MAGQREEGRGGVQAKELNFNASKTRLPPTVLSRPLLCTQRADLHFLRGAQRSTRGHQAHGCCAEEAVGSAQGRRTEPARPGQGQGAPYGQGLNGALWWREDARHRSVPQDLDPRRAAWTEGSGRASLFLLPGRLPGEIWTCSKGGNVLADTQYLPGLPPPLTTGERPKRKPPAFPYRGTWAAAGAGSSSSSKSSMVAA